MRLVNLPYTGDELTSYSYIYGTIILQGQFSGGRARGKGLITFADGTHGRPTNEGSFEDNKCVERCKVPDAVRKAREAASDARKKAQRLL